MTLPASFAVQTALYAALEADPALAAIGTDGVRFYDEVPEDAGFPFVTLGEARVSDYPGIPGARSHEVRLHAYSRWGGRAELKRIEAAIKDALHDADLQIDGHTCEQCRFVFADVIRQPDLDTFAAVLRYRIVTTEAPA